MSTPMPAAEVMRLADIMLPGDDLFPSASASGMEPLLMARLAAAENGSLIARLAAAVAAEKDDLSPAVVTRIAAADGKLFDEIRKIIYATYYEQDKVVTAIRALGMPYNDTPLPEGYAPERFDPTVDAPKHRRGHWTPTDRVVRADLHNLVHLKAMQS